MITRERIYLILGDLGLVWLGLFLALWLRTELSWTRTLGYLEEQTWFLAALSLTVVLLFWLRGLYTRDWRYVGIGDAIDVLVTLVIAFVPFQLITLTARGIAFPRAGLAFAFLPVFFLLAGFRILVRLGSESKLRRKDGLRYLVVGFNDAAEVAVRELQRSGGEAVGLVGTEDKGLRPSIRGCPYLGHVDELVQLAADTAADGVILAGLKPAANLAVMEKLEGLDLKLRTLPPVSELLQGEVQVQTLRPLALEDLLEREPVKICRQSVGSYLKGESVLVTGAGGSIGSEIVRQLLPLMPEKIILFGRGENSIHEILIEVQRSVKAKGSGGVELIPFIGDIRDRLSLDEVFSKYEPTIVFHAAAHKHVPLMESRPVEACSNNIFGTMNLMEACRSNGVKRLIALSTDKAVAPSSVMGATKKVMELLLHTSGMPGCAAVRFGNVLGSRGSVVPTLQQQIAVGGPVTITSPEMERFFMTIPEAVSLVLGAGSLVEGGEIYVLEMGQPVKIVSLAENLIRLSGYVPHRDMAIEFTGVRPGEKLTEHLVEDGESCQPSGCPGILRVTPTKLDPDWPRNSLDALRLAVQEGDQQAARSHLFRLVQEP